MNEENSKLALYMDKHLISSKELAKRSKRNVSSIYSLRKSGIHDYVVACGYARILMCDVADLWEGLTAKKKGEIDDRISELQKHKEA